ncbi:MAG: hypothetical protein AB7O56_08220 [Bauldia sp.]
MRRLLKITLAGAFALATAGAATAQDFAPFAIDPADPTVLRLDGDIVGGTAETFEAALAAYPDVRQIVLRGEGDTFEDALAIAGRVHELGLATRVEANSFCFFACGLIYLAGTERKTEGIVGVGILLPSTNNLAAAQMGLADLVELLLTFDLSPEIMSALLQTRPGSMYAFSPHEIARFGLDRPAVDGPAGYDAAPYAILYEHAPEGPPETAWPSFPATATWSVDDSGPLPALILTAEAPDRSLVLTATFTATPRENAEPLFAVDVSFRLGDNFLGTGIEFVVLLARNFEGTGGIGGFDNGEERVPNQFHFALDDHALTWPTLKVHLERRWMSFVLGYENADAAELLIEVGEAGRAVIDPVLAAWQAADEAAPLTAIVPDEPRQPPPPKPVPG